MGTITFTNTSPNITFTVGYGALSVVKDFTDLNDTPADYTGQAGKAALVNPAEDGIEFGEVANTSTFLELTDTPPDYTGQAGNLVKVNNSEDGLTYGGASGVTVAWGDITGTLSNQTDLQGELDGKENAFSKNTAFNKNYGTIADTVTQGNDARLSDSRDPNPHTHVEVDITDLDKYTQAQVDAALATKEPVISPKNTAFNKDFGSAVGTVTQGNDSRLSDARTPTPHAASHANGQADAISHTILADVGSLTHLQIESSLNNKLEAVEDDTAPKLGGALNIAGNQVILDKANGEVHGIVGALDVGEGAYLSYSADGSYDSADGGIAAYPGQLHLAGTVVNVAALKGSENRDVQVTPDGTLFAAALADPGWSYTDTDNGDYALPVLDAWVEITGLVGIVQADVANGDRLDIAATLHVIETGLRDGTIDVGFEVGTGTPPTTGQNYQVIAGFDGIIPVSWSTTTHGGLVTNDNISIWARKASQTQAGFAPEVHGSSGNTHELTISVPGAGGGGGGDATNLGNIPGPTSVTITSSTGANTVVAGAVSGTAGMMTGAQVDSLNGKAALTDITYERLDTNGDVGTSAGQLAIGNHLHAGVYEPADATIIKQADVDDIPVDAATTAPISSNWAFDHINAADPHTQYLTQAEGDAAYEPIITPKNTAFNVNFGSGAGTACQGNDSRLSDARTPTSHAASHGTGQADEVTPAAIGAATAAQGALADSATQPGDNVSTLTNDSAFISSVSTDATLTGDGTSGDPLSVVGGGGGGDTLTNIAGPDSNTTMVVGNNYICSPQTVFTASRTYTLPATASDNDEIGVMCSEDAADREVAIHYSGAVEWSRLFIKDENVIFRWSSAVSAWLIKEDGRLPANGKMYLTADIVNYLASSNVNYLLPVDATDYDVGNYADLAQDAFVVRRSGLITIQGGWTTSDPWVDYPRLVTQLNKNGLNIGASVTYPYSLSSYQNSHYKMAANLAVGDLITAFAKYIENSSSNMDILATFLQFNEEL